MIGLKIAGGVVAALLAYVLIAGSVVARGHVTSVRIVLKRPPAEVFAEFSPEPVASCEKPMPNVVLNPGWFAWNAVARHDAVAVLTRKSSPLL